jgi:hypothetical protein
LESIVPQIPIYQYDRDSREKQMATAGQWRRGLLPRRWGGGYPGLASAFPCVHHAAGGADGLDAIKAARQAILEHAIFTVQESAGMQPCETAYPTPSLENAIRGRAE